jgi:hypothetical protein
MAGDRVEGILQDFQQGQKDSRPAADVTSHCWRILVNAEDVDGQVEGLIEVMIRLSGSLTCDETNRQMIGELCPVRSPSFSRLSALTSQSQKIWPRNARIPFFPFCLLPWRPDFPR